ncbi:hypothetical protein RHSIM_Rhsim10G0182300 [Rhododendron simsii]|uniref:DUF4371 domain-containing protein n=1 Tax=Rhododendron simsii TaxID=118357 RepID=A0A834GD59_RHOSS|nr:hypothetical protein RHSIM_Rhsim10G0182300 [Rhododendron simsii]
MIESSLIQRSHRGNFIELIKFEGKLDGNIADVVLEKAPKNAKYTSPLIQKEILHIFGNKVRNKIREEVGDAKFCILVDEAKDASNREQMLTSIVTLVGASPKRHTELQSTQAIEIEHMLDTGERETAWLTCLLRTTIKVLEMMFEKGSSNSIRGEKLKVLY